MTLTAYRLCVSRFKDQAFSGEGARKWGGRWNPPGFSVVYVSSTLSLASLEFLVHFAFLEDLPELVSFRLEFDHKLVLTADSLPRDWQEIPLAKSTQTLGADWVYSMRSAVLRVPSVIIPSEDNFILNPGHPDFRQIKIGAAKPFSIDPHLLVKRKQGD